MESNPPASDSENALPVEDASARGTAADISIRPALALAVGPGGWLQELLGTRTDLPRLLLRSLCLGEPYVIVTTRAVARWQRDAPEAWAAAQRHLQSYGVGIITL
jgi:hypothetical protein